MGVSSTRYTNTEPALAHGWRPREVDVPMRFELGPEDDRCTIHLDGLITFEDLKTGVDAQVAAGAWTRRTLLDTSQATGIVVNFDDVHRLVDFVGVVSRGQPPRGRTAILAPQDVVYGCARMYQIAVEEVVPTMQLLVVRTRAEAEEWLES